MQADKTLQCSNLFPNSKMNSSPTVLFGQSLKLNDFAEYVDSLSSFETWPQQMNQDKYTLAQAGFIYKKGRRHCGMLRLRREIESMET